MVVSPVSWSISAPIAVPRAPTGSWRLGTASATRRPPRSCPRTPSANRRSPPRTRPASSRAGDSRRARSRQRAGRGRVRVTATAGDTGGVARGVLRGRGRGDEQLHLQRQHRDQHQVREQGHELDRRLTVLPAPGRSPHSRTPRLTTRPTRGGRTGPAPSRRAAMREASATWMCTHPYNASCQASSSARATTGNSTRAERPRR